MEKSQANMSGEKEAAYPFLVCWWKKKSVCGREIARKGELAQKHKHSLAQLLILLLNAFWVF